VVLGVTLLKHDIRNLAPVERRRIAMAMLREIQALFLRKRGLKIRGPADQAGLAFLAAAALERGLMKMSLCRAISAWISFSVAPGQRTSAAGNSTC
jgi:hypothetical protein